jgi:hypothetical protein
VSDIIWTNEKRKLSDLIPWPRNPRQIRKEQVDRLQESLEVFGQVEPVCIGPGNELYNGHQRLKSWAAKFGDIEIDVRVSSRALTEKEREKLTVFLHKGASVPVKQATLEKYFDIKALFAAYDYDTLPARYLRTWARVEKVWPAQGRANSFLGWSKYANDR